jgi:hypothetical protein
VSNIRFGTPPPNRIAPLLDYDSVVAELNERRGEWALVYSSPRKSSALGVRNSLQRRGAEVMTRSNQAEVDVWARMPGVES